MRCTVLLWIAMLPSAVRADSTPCLADELPAALTYNGNPRRCTADDDACRMQCEQNDGAACLGRAYGLADPEALPLFERACRLGLSLGCTNWAAHHFTHDSEVRNSCLARVFAKACDARDRWGCTMYGRAQIEGYRIRWTRTVAQRLSGYIVLHRSCDTLGRESCRYLAWFIEREAFGRTDVGTIHTLMERACKTGDDRACGDHATVDETIREHE